MRLTARPLRPDEWQDLRAIRLRALADAPGNFFRTLAEEEAAPDTRWHSLLAQEQAVTFGLFDGSTLVGITGAYRDYSDPSGATCGFGMTWLDPAVRGQGGSRLIYACRIGWAREQGFARICVSHRDGNEPSRRAMLAAGFRSTSASPHLWPDGAEALDVRYELDLLDNTASGSRQAMSSRSASDASRGT